MTKPAEAYPRGSRIRRWVTFAVVAVVVLWIFRFVWLRLTLRPTPRPEYWAAKIAELDPPPPGAMSSDEANRILSDFVQAIEDPYKLSDVLSVGWTTRHQALADSIFQRPEFQPAHKAVREAARRGWYEPPDFRELPAPHISFARMSFQQQWTVGLRTHARWSVMRGDADIAKDDYLTALRLARNEMRPRTAHQISDAWPVVNAVARELILMSREHPGVFTSRQLFQPISDILGCDISPLELLEGERLRVNAFFDQWFVRDGGDWFCVSAAVHTPSGRQPSRWWNVASPLFPSRLSATASIEQVIQQIANCPNLGALNELSEEMAQQTDVNLHEIFGDADEYSLVGAARSYHAAWCRMQAALAILALADYRTDHSRYPESLTQLVPEYLPELPIDCYDRKPLRYRRTSDDYVLYSVGRDGADDGGGMTGRRPDSLFTWDSEDVVLSATERGDWGK